MRIDEAKREELQLEITKLHNYLTELNHKYYDTKKERVMIDYPNNSEDKELELEGVMARIRKKPIM